VKWKGCRDWIHVDRDEIQLGFLSVVVLPRAPPPLFGPSRSIRPVPFMLFNPMVLFGSNVVLCQFAGPP